MMEHNDRSRADEGRVESGRSGPSAALIALILLGVAVLLFVLYNGDDADVDFVFTDVDLPLWIVIAISIAVGIIIDRLIQFWWRRTRRRDD